MPISQTLSIDAAEVRRSPDRHGLRQLARTSEAPERPEALQDLFDEAPIAYVHEDLDSRFIRANRAAIKLLGIKPEAVTETLGRSLVADALNPQLCEAFRSVAEGKETGGVVLELRRQDNGEPVWVQWWSKPAPDGTYTRTMMVDITAQFLQERATSRLRAQNEHLVEELQSQNNFGEIIGNSAGLRQVMQQVHLVAATNAAVLIGGESGTGKEIVARAIHERSSRKGGALIKVNCGAVPETLFESEFFGHAKGSFTGALKDKPGRFELADGGTLFLDEVGEIPLSMQAKLLRVLQEQEVERIGDTRTRKINVRIIAATNRDLFKEVAAGRFRQDLFYRLSVFPIKVPPLRERRDDIPLLASHFVRLYARKMNRSALSVSESALSALAACDWPGNVRELQNAVERAVILWQSGPLCFDVAEASATGSVCDSPALEPRPVFTRHDLKLRERNNLAAALKQAGGRLSGPEGAAKLLGMRPTTLASRVKALGLNAKPQHA